MPNSKKVYLSASITVEASLVLPLFIFAAMSVMYFMQIIEVQIRMQQALYNESRKIAKYAYLYESFDKEIDGRVNDIDTYTDRDKDYQKLMKMGIGFVSAHAMLVSELGENYISDAHIVGGKNGLDITKSKFLRNSNDIELIVAYALKNPFNIFGAPNMSFSQKAHVKAWIGDKKEENDTGENKQIVYITTNGSVYHTGKSCTYLNPSIMEITYELVQTRRNQSGSKYGECEKCKEYEVKQGKLYITLYGDRYHTIVNCSALYRNIISVKISEIDGMGKCVKCSERDGK